MLLVHFLCLMCGVLSMLSWAALLAGVVGMLLFPIFPYPGIVMAIAVYYLVGCWLIRMLGWLCGFSQAVGPVIVPPAPVRIRRVILEEITPYDPQRRLVLEERMPIHDQMR